MAGSSLTPLISTVADVISAIGTSVAAAGVWFAHRQLVAGREIAQTQFEDGLAKEYRDLANRLPTSALLGDALDEGEYASAFDEFFRYVDLSNEQVCLRQFGRIGPNVWEQWRQGIEANLRLPAFSRAWLDIKGKSKSFQELRRLEQEGFATDPREWIEPL